MFLSDFTDSSRILLPEMALYPEALLGKGKSFMQLHGSTIQI